MKMYPDELKVKDALQLYFSKYHFTNGGYNDKWFKIKIGFLYIPLPNTSGRIAAVKIHDIHHIITEYTADIKGEAEIAGWEIASGCGRYYIAWILNAGSFFYGLFIFPRALFRAFINGRKAKTNFYKATVYNEQLLNQTVGSVRKECLESVQKANNFSDVIFFILFSIVVLLPSIIVLFLVYSLF
jgi:hypothetical protein